MRAATDIFIILSFILAAAGCNNRSKFGQRLASLDSVLVSNPDSVYRVLTGMEKNVNDQSESDRMYYNLLRADAQNKAYIDFTTDSVMLNVVEYYDRHGSANEKMRAHYLLGCTYRDLGDAPMELQCFLDAVERNELSNIGCDYYTMSAIYGQIANIYNSQYLPEEELKALEMCERVSKLVGDTLSAIKAYELKIRPYILLNKPDSVLMITHNALNMYKMLNHLEVGARSVIPAVSIFIDRQQLNEAQVYLDFFEKEGNIYEENGIVRKDCILYLYEKGRLKCLMGEYDKAKDCFYKLLQNRQMEAGCKGLLMVYEHTHQIDSIAKYSKLYAAYNDSSFVDVHQDVIERMTASYNYNLSQKEKERVSSQLAVSRTRLALVLGVLLVCIIVFLYVVYKYKKSKLESRKQINALNSRIDQDSIVLKELRSKQDADDIRYKKILDDSILRTEELEKTKEQYLKIKESRERTISLLSEEIRQLKEQISQSNLKDLLSSFYEDDTYAIFKTCGSNGLVNIRKTEWNKLMSKFSHVFVTYFDVLQKNALTQDQERVCVLIRLGFKEAEMANIMNKNSSQINKIKIQINKKMFGGTDSKSLKSNLKQYFD